MRKLKYFTLFACTSAILSTTSFSVPTIEDEDTIKTLGRTKAQKVLDHSISVLTECINGTNISTDPIKEAMKAKRIREKKARIELSATRIQSILRGHLLRKLKIKEEVKRVAYKKVRDKKRHSVMELAKWICDNKGTKHKRIVGIGNIGRPNAPLECYVINTPSAWHNVSDGNYNNKQAFFYIARYKIAFDAKKRAVKRSLRVMKYLRESQGGVKGRGKRFLDFWNGVSEATNIGKHIKFFNTMAEKYLPDYLQKAKKYRALKKTLETYKEQTRIYNQLWQEKAMRGLKTIGLDLIGISLEEQEKIKHEIKRDVEIIQAKLDKFSRPEVCDKIRAESDVEQAGIDVKASLAEFNRVYVQCQELREDPAFQQSGIQIGQQLFGNQVFSGYIKTKPKDMGSEEIS